MATDQKFFTNINALKARIAALPDIVDAKLIQQATARLEEIHFTPTLMLQPNAFLISQKPMCSPK
ncbi:hypothetical protein U14_05122 [Candidatus Moduliflexus flocculans]|uniref:Uncharacterized protein n=1 Tax=Candidatus Moduliflexus flocculans TaxID=1499966 RepID=A0A081BR17_9BACT|nr:hypothetical protein U14_05122 [Candidatus Moduliflexus flocculans]